MSIRDPYPSELIPDREFAEFVARLSRHPQMYVSPATFETVCAFLDGYNHAGVGGPLTGFREWLVIRADGCNNLTWPGIVKRLLGVTDAGENRDRDWHHERIKDLGSLFEVFFTYRRSVGVTKLYHDYGEWLLRQEWYQGPLRPIA